MERRLIAATILALRGFTATELAALNTAVCLWGRVDVINLAYTRALEAALINPDGSVSGLPELKRALAHVINERMKAGTFE
jgi:hypothetical protein